MSQVAHLLPSLGIGCYSFWDRKVSNPSFSDSLFGCQTFCFLHCQIQSFQWRDFPGGPAVKNLPSIAGDSGSSPGQGTKIPHAAGQLGPRATTTEFVRLNERAHMPQTTEPTHPGAHTPQLETHTPQLERGLRAATKRSRMPQWRPRTSTKT